MNRKTILTILSIILILYAAGFIIRWESTNLPGIPEEEKSFYIMDDEGTPYMYELDSYYHYRLTKNYLDHGYLGDTFIDGVEWDSYSYAPPGVPMDYPPLLIYLTAFLYKLINLFATVPLLTVGFWLPAFFGPLAGVVTYLFVRRFSNDIAGLVSGLLVVLSPFYLLRTVPGWFDTDMFIIFFSVLVVWFLMEAIHSKALKMKILYSSLSAITLFLFSIAWNGWQYIFYLMIIFTTLYIIWRYLKGRPIKGCLIILGIFAGGSLLLILLFTGLINFLKPFYGFLEIFNLMGNPWSPWPDLYVMVSELHQISIYGILFRLGLIFFAMGILGCLLIFRLMIKEEMKTKYLNKKTRFLFIFLISWAMLGFISLYWGARFIILLIPPLAVIAGIGFGIIIKYLYNLNINPKFRTFFSIILIIIIITPQFLSAYDILVDRKPLSNDDLWDAATWIKDNTSNETLVITDWSYGHLITGIGERPVALDGRSAYIETLPVRQFYGDNLTFDGEIPNTSREYWMSRAFSTSNESLSMGIFNMLATSGDYAYLTLDEYTNDTIKSVEILNEILGLDRSSAEQILVENYNFSDEEVEDILKYSHPEEIRPYVILTYDRMITTGHWNLKFGQWDFELEEKGNFTYSVGHLQTNNTLINSTNDIIYNIKDETITWEDKEPYSFIQIKNGMLNRTRIDENSNFTVILDYSSKKAVVMDKKFENSLFTRLVLEKQDTQFFESIYKNKKVNVWKVTSY